MTSESTGTRRTLLRAGAFRLGLFAGLWLLLAEGSRDGWAVPALVVIAATVTSLAVRRPAAAWSIPGLVRFVPYFLSQSVRGGVDVARSAFSPGLPINPGTEEYLVRLPDERQRVTLAAILGLLPGTLSVRLSGRRLRIHVLNRRMGTRDSVRELERRLADLFGAEIRDDEAAIDPDLS